jgi:hypothetical protein
MRVANIIAAVSAFAWLAFALTIHIDTVEQANFYVIWPLYVVLVITGTAWICNALQRFAWVLGVVSAVTLIGLLPYCAVSGGGM